MRELTLIETCYLAGGLLLSLVLPLLVNFGGPDSAAARTSCMRTVWTGQFLLAFAGLAVLASGTLAFYAVAFGLVSWSWCVFVLLRQFRRSRIG